MNGASPELPAKLSDADARRRLRDLAHDLLRGNDDGVFVRPGRQQYPHQWNWDAAVVALGLSTVDPERARREVRSLLKGQWNDGMVPHVVYHGGASDYFPTPDFWRTDTTADAPRDPATTGLTQPPLLATCVRGMHRRALATDDPAEMEASRAFVREVFPALLAWHRWFHRARDPDGTGLVAILHPWESGNDNAARWVPPLMAIGPRDVPRYQRRDQAHVVADERPLSADYERYMDLIGRFRTRRWEPATLYAESPFLVQDPLVNAILHRAHEDLAALAAELGEPTDELRGWRDGLQRAFDARLWNADDGLYYAFDARHRQQIRDNGCAAFLALYGGLASSAQAERLVAHLRDPVEYAPDTRTRYLLPSQAKNHYFYEPRRYWRGPVWIIVNWLVSLGLERYDYHHEAAHLRRDALELVAEHGFHEYYDPRDGSPAGATDFSWSAALALELLAPFDAT